MSQVYYKTPERLAVVRQWWPTKRRVPEIVDAVNQLPGNGPVSARLISHWATDMRLLRPNAPNGIWHREQYDARAREVVRLFKEMDRVEPAPERAPAPRSANGSYCSTWPDDQLQHFYRLWREGHSTQEIADRIGCTKNSIIGKSHRLIAIGAIERRGPPRPPKPEVAAEPVPPPLPARTIPPLPSEMAGITEAPPPAAVAALAIPQPVKREAKPPKPVLTVPKNSPRPKHMFPSEPTPPSIPAPRPMPAPKRAVDIGPSRKPCQWIVEDGSVIQPWIMCGVDRTSGSPYCGTHHKRAYVRLRT